MFEARWIENAMLAWRYGMFAKAEHDVRLLAERRGDEIDPKDIFSAWKLKIDYELQAIKMFLTIFIVLFTIPLVILILLYIGFFSPITELECFSIADWDLLVPIFDKKL